MPMVIDGIFASEMPDKAAEVLIISGLDISDLKEGRGVLNFEHKNSKDDGASFNDTIGRVIFAKKIYKLEDCSNERERSYYRQVECPMLYGKAVLFNDEGHLGAQAAAAIVRHCAKNKIPLMVKFSIEGSTIEQEGCVLKRCIARSVAATLRPANSSAVSGLVSDGEEIKEKEPSADDPLAFLIGTKKHEHPDRHLFGSSEIQCDPEIHDLDTLTERLQGLQKMITAGQYNVAPGSLTGGAALQREDFGHELQDVGFRNKAKAALRDYDPDTHGEFKAYAKHHLPEASDAFLDRFADAVKDFSASKKQILAKGEEEPSGRAVRSGGGMSTGSTAFKAKQKKYEHKLQDIKEQAAQTGLPGMGETGPAIPPAETPEFKIRTGKRLKHGEAYFDQSNGVLHTADDRFKVYIPDLNDRRYGEILKDPELNRIHDAAMKNWMMVHKTMQAGKAPPEMVALAALFSAMSPNTAVPMQELAYGHLMDIMGAPTGQGGFERFDPTKEQSRKEQARYAKEFHTVSKGQMLPAWERDHFSKRTAGIWTAEGKRHIIGLGAQKWAGAKNYHELHKTLVDLVAKHGTDARTIAGILNDMKQRSGTKTQGEDPDVKGFAPKTIRYLLGIMGAGNCLDEKTEALTQRGWVKGFELKDDDILLTKNSHSDKLEWQVPTHIHRFPEYDGDVIEIRSRSFHSVTTPDHRWLVTSKINSEGRGGVVKEKTSSTLTFGADKIHRTGEYIAPSQSALSPDEAELLGWFVTDGGYRYKKNKSGQCRGTARFSPPGVYAYLTQSEIGNPDKCLRISRLLARVDPNATTKLRPTGERVWTLSPASVTMLYARVPDRTLTVKCLLDLDHKALERLYEAMILGDGSVRQNDEAWSKHESLGTGRPNQAGAFQALAMMLGKSSSLKVLPPFVAVKKYESMSCIPKSKEFCVVGVQIRKFALVEKEHVSRYRAKVGMWCVTVPNSFFVVRRSGQVYITGNCVVPDTHFIRHTFGLHTADPRSDVLKKYLWNEKNEPLLAEIDKYYLAHHPAVAHTRAKMQQQFGEDLGEQALFPAFWLHWLTVQPHEKARGWFERGQAKNADTDHGVFWNAVKRVLTKYGIPHDHRLIKHEFEDGGSMAVRVAHAVKELENQFGFVPASLALYSTMIPAVLHNKELAKAEELTERLQELVKGEKKPKKPKAVPFQGKDVFPGELEVIAGARKGQKFPLLDVGKEFHHVQHPDGKVRKVNAKSGYYRINSEPKASGLGFLLVDAKKHGVPGLSEHPDQQAILHGIDLNSDAIPGAQSGLSARNTGSLTGFRKSKAGHFSYVKPAFAMDEFVHPNELEGFTTAHREAAFHHLAKNFFGLGQHVPVTAAFHHPTDGAPFSAQKMVEGAQHYEYDKPKHGAALNTLKHTGQLDKLALMDMIMGSDDRHEGNFVFTPGEAPYLHLIDNGLTMRGEYNVSSPPDYLKDDWAERRIHPEAVAWAQKLNPGKLQDMLFKMGVPGRAREETVRRLQALQNRLSNRSPEGKPYVFKNQPVTLGSAFYSPFTGMGYDQGTADFAPSRELTEDRAPSGEELASRT